MAQNGSDIPKLPRSAAGRHNPWLIAFVVSLATFMEVLDTTICNVSLRHIAGGLGSGQDESTWILTSYLISNAIILPVSGWLSTLIGRKRFYMICVALFTASSFLCALSPNLPFMLFFRVLQGLGGGGLAPTEQSIFADTFPPEKRAIAFAFYGVTVIVAPAAGPFIGGWLTQTFSWHWVFLINLPVGIAALVLIWFLVDEPPAVRRDTINFRKRFIPDWLGFTLVALTFGSLQVVLDRFEQDDGFSSLMIVMFATVCVFSAASLIWWERQHPQPVFDVKLFKVRSFAGANIVMFIAGFTLFSTTQLIPQLAQELLGYDVLNAGKTLALGGLASAAVMPFAGIVASRVQPKWLIGSALVATGFALIHTANLSLQMSFGTLALARALQAVPLPFLFVSLTSAAYVGIPPNKNSDASALINLSRNLGGSVGIATATTMLAWRTQFHHERLGSHLTVFDPQGALAHSARAAQQVVQTQAQALSYLDIFWAFGMAAIVASPIVFLLKRIPKGQAAHGH
ncbi:MAG: DHA2 family efflux MFS transporter permease subunit [Burkholderiaceae bacterium]